MKITRLQIKNFRGIEALESSVPAAGAVVSGRNAAGKTSVLRAIQAALAARGVDPTAIRLGADKAEIVVDLDDMTVRRVITAKGNSVTVTKDGFKATKPQGMLDELLGGAAIDPVELFLATAKDRRRQILAALPVTVTPEKLRRWIPTLRDDVDCAGHGLEVLERLRKQAYDRRTVANAGAKSAAADAARARTEADAFARGLPATSTTVADASAQEERARAHHVALEGQRAQALKSRERTQKARARIAELKAKAAGLRVSVPEITEIDTLAARIGDIENQIAALRLELEQVTDRRTALIEQRDAAVRSCTESDQLLEQAAELETTVADATTPEPSADELAQAFSAISRAAEVLADARAAERAAILDHRAKELAGAAEVASKEADRLDAMVQALTNDAPAALLAEADAIPGLSIDGDTITLDGRDIEKLSSAEQMRFAVDIAKRLNGKTRLLLVDGLERLDPEAMERFLTDATSGGWQIICTKVSGGERVIEAISSEEDSNAQAAE